MRTTTCGFCGEELDNYLRNHDLEDEEYLKQTDIYEDYKLLNRLLVEQMAGMPFEEMVARLRQIRTRLDSLMDNPWSLILSNQSI